MRVLCVNLGDSKVSSLLTSEGMEVVQAASAAEALGMAKHDPFGLVIVGFVEPISTLGAIGAFREEGHAIPIVVHGRSTDHSTEAALFDAGADDYVLSTCHDELLLAKLRARTRQRGSRFLRVGSWELNVEQRLLRIGGRRFPMRSVQPYRILGFLMERADQVCSREEIIAGAFEGEVPQERTVDVYIKRIRDPIADVNPREARRIFTASKLGYMFRTEIPSA